MAQPNSHTEWQPTSHFWQVVSSDYLWPTIHTVIGRPKGLITHFRMSNKETTVLIGHVTDRDEVRLTKLWSAGLPPNARNMFEHIREIKTAGEACFARL